jgi:hypothetical protein
MKPGKDSRNRAEMANYLNEALEQGRASYYHLVNGAVMEGCHRRDRLSLPLQPVISIPSAPYTPDIRSYFKRKRLADDHVDDEDKENVPLRPTKKMRI